MEAKTLDIDTLKDILKEIQIVRNIIFIWRKKMN
ncbi:Uncharacterised protein [Campylobacter helveticus]|nr:Uncharacterised protein [Campylobacter helveticus]